MPTREQSKLEQVAKPVLRDENADDGGWVKEIHTYNNGIVCATDKRGHENPRGLSPAEIVVDATNGFIPLWAPNTTLRWRFQERSLLFFENPEEAKQYIRLLMGNAVIEWGDSAPVRFSEERDGWDFEIVMQPADNCTPRGCSLARAFFPDSGRHEVLLYPKMFQQSSREQVETFIHEIGHIFGLRHFFAQVSETRWRSEIFGTHRPFSIMNYGSQSVLTDDDKNDLKRLYQAVWNGSLEKINGTPIRLFESFSTARIRDPLFGAALPIAAAVADSHTKDCCPNVVVNVNS